MQDSDDDHDEQTNTIQISK